MRNKPLHHGAMPNYLNKYMARWENINYRLSLNESDRTAANMITNMIKRYYEGVYYETERGTDLETTYSPAFPISNTVMMKLTVTIIL